MPAIDKATAISAGWRFSSIEDSAAVSMVMAVLLNVVTTM
jgi:hypothetical protein